MSHKDDAAASPAAEPLPGWDRGIAVAFLAGLALSSYMVFQSQVAYDQLLLLARGWKLAFHGEWLFLGVPMSGGGYVPGGLTSLFVGLPLLAWPDSRAPAVFALLLHVVAYVLLDRVVGRALGRTGRQVFAVFYWLNPWRLYHSAFLWTPNLLLILGAVHFWTLYQLRNRPRFWPTLLHVLVLGAAIQIHPSALLLVAVSGVLLARGFFKVHPTASGLGLLLTAGSLVPWGLLVAQDPALLPLQGGGPNRPAQPLSGLARGIGYWLRYPSLYVAGTTRCLDFGVVLGQRFGQAARPMQGWILGVLGVFSLLMPLWANYRLWSRARRRWSLWRRASDPRRAWLEGVVRWTFLAAIPVFLLSPTTLMSWQILALFHVAVLVAVLQLGPLFRSRWRRGARGALRLHAAVSLAVCLAVAIASPPFRPGGDRCGHCNVLMPPLKASHAILEDLGIREDNRAESPVRDQCFPPDVLSPELVEAPTARSSLSRGSRDAGSRGSPVRRSCAP